MYNTRFIERLLAAASGLVQFDQSLKNLSLIYAWNIHFEKECQLNCTRTLHTLEDVGSAEQYTASATDCNTKEDIEQKSVDDHRDVLPVVAILKSVLPL